MVEREKIVFWKKKLFIKENVNDIKFFKILKRIKVIWAYY